MLKHILPEPCPEKVLGAAGKGPYPLKTNYAVGWDDCLALCTTAYTELEAENARLEQVAIDRKDELTAMCTELVDSQAGMTELKREFGVSKELSDELAALFTRGFLDDRMVADIVKIVDTHHSKQPAEGRIEVDAEALFCVLKALGSDPHRIRELQATRGLPDNSNPIDILVTEFNAYLAALPGPTNEPD